MHSARVEVITRGGVWASTAWMKIIHGVDNQARLLEGGIKPRERRLIDDRFGDQVLCAERLSAIRSASTTIWSRRVRVAQVRNRLPRFEFTR